MMSHNTKINKQNGRLFYYFFPKSMEITVDIKTRIK